jgi:peroxiredoxin
MIKIGDNIPDATLMRLTESGIIQVELKDLLKNRNIVLFALPGAYTPTCTKKHLHGFVEHADKIRANGVDEIICVSVNDVFVLDAWGKAARSDGRITILSDWDGSFAKAMGLTFFDDGALSLGLRSMRYNALVINGVLKKIDVEEDPGACGVTHADKIFSYL